MFESCPRNIESKFSETCFLLFDELSYVFCITVIIVSKKGARARVLLFLIYDSVNYFTRTLRPLTMLIPF